MKYLNTGITIIMVLFICSLLFRLYLDYRLLKNNDCQYFLDHAEVGDTYPLNTTKAVPSAEDDTGKVIDEGE